MAEGSQLVLWIAGVHLVGFLCVAAMMLPALRGGPSSQPGRNDGESDEGWGRGPKPPPTRPEPPRGGIPLPDAVPSRIRLREPGRLSDHRPQRERRPVREPARRLVRVPHRGGR